MGISVIWLQGNSHFQSLKSLERDYKWALDEFVVPVNTPLTAFWDPEQRTQLDYAQISDPHTLWSNKCIFKLKKK